MKQLQDASAGFFIAAVALLSGISILGVWNVLAKDVINKSYETIGLLAIVAIIVVFAAHFVEARQATPVVEGTPPSPPTPNMAFQAVRRIMIAVLIVAASLLALVGVLGIWDVITDQDLLSKTVSTLGILVFAAVIIVPISLWRENNPVFMKKISAGNALAAIFLIFVGYILFSWLTSSLAVRHTTPTYTAPPVQTVKVVPRVSVADSSAVGEKINKIFADAKQLPAKNLVTLCSAGVINTAASPQISTDVAELLLVAHVADQQTAGIRCFAADTTAAIEANVQTGMICIDTAGNNIMSSGQAAVSLSSKGLTCVANNIR